MRIHRKKIENELIIQVSLQHGWPLSSSIDCLLFFDIKYSRKVIAMGGSDLTPAKMSKNTRLGILIPKWLMSPRLGPWKRQMKQIIFHRWQHLNTFQKIKFESKLRFQRHEVPGNAV